MGPFKPFQSSRISQDSERRLQITCRISQLGFLSASRYLCTNSLPSTVPHPQKSDFKGNRFQHSKTARTASAVLVMDTMKYFLD